MTENLASQTQNPATQSASTKHRGATIGLIIGAAVLLIVTIVAAAAGTYAVSTPRLAPTPAPTPTPTPSYVSLASLQPGACLPRQLDDAGLWGTDTVDCLAPHVAEVYAVFDLLAGRYPQLAQATPQAQKICKGALTSQLATEIGKSTVMQVSVPSKDRYEPGKNTIVCAVAIKTGTWTGHHDSRFA